MNSLNGVKSFRSHFIIIIIIIVNYSLLIDCMSVFLQRVVRPTSLQEYYKLRCSISNYHRGNTSR